jgi:membrane-bound lytic murein transglycosylase B
MRKRVFAATLVVSALLALPPAAVGQEPAAPEHAAGGPPFSEWLAEFRVEALAQGVSEATFDRAFEGVEAQAVIVERDRTQTEKILTVDEYIARRVTPAVVRRARHMTRQHARVLREVEKAYGVPRQVLVAIWALESNFGRFSGVRPTIPALATLAWEGRRAAFFRSELLDALAILDRGDIPLQQMKGSWAGAMGQVQFMPSSYLRYAQDVDGDGRKNIWTSIPDVFGSIAFYLKEHGWESGLPWGYAVTLPDGENGALEKLQRPRDEGCGARRLLTASSPVTDWRRAGVVPVKAGVKRAPAASLLQAGERAYLVTGNYEALLAYNCAHSYALSVGVLADRIGTAR